MGLAPSNPQLSLLDVRPTIEINGNAQARNVYGAVAQEMVCRALGLNPIPINGNFKTCFDAERRGNHFEIKSVRKANKVVLYDFRMHKEALSEGLRYAIFVHQIKTAGSFEDIAAQLAAKGTRIIVISAAMVHALAFREPLRKIEVPEGADSRIGYNRDGYRDGYRNLPVKRLEEITHFTAMLTVDLYGTPVQVELLTQ